MPRRPKPEHLKNTAVVTERTQTLTPEQKSKYKLADTRKNHKKRKSVLVSRMMTKTEREFYENTPQKKATYRAKWGKVKLDPAKPRTDSVLGNNYSKTKKLATTSNDLLPGRPTVELPRLWDPRPYQIPAWRALENGAQRAVLLWHRRAGKDSVALAWTTVASQLRVGLYWHVFPTYNQGKKAIWKGMTKEGRPFLDMWPPELIKRGPIEDEMLIELKNGSIWQVVGTDNIDRLVGSNPVGVVFSEYALQDPRAWDLIRPILNENGGWAIFPYTPRGKNHGFELFDRAHSLMKKDPRRWFAQRLTVDDTKAIPLSVIEEDRQSGMEEATVRQEYWCDFDAPLVGSYYGDQMRDADREGRIKELPWLPNFPVDTWWDIGTRDETAVWFVQRKPDGWVDVIDFYQASGKGVDHYAKVLKEKPYSYGKHLGPHDLSKTEWGTGKKIVETALGFGIRFTVGPKLDIQEGIQAARSLLPRCRFDVYKCAHGLRALKEYQKKWNEKTRAFSESPQHDWTSHPADAFRYGAIAMRESVQAPVQTVAQNDWDVFAAQRRPTRQSFAIEHDPFGEQ